MPDDRRMRILDRLEKALRLFLFRQLEAAMDACNHEIELFQYVVRIIQRAVREYVCLDPFQDTEFAAVTLVQPVGLAVLLRDFLDREPARIMCRLRMVGDAEIFEPALSCASAIVSSVSVPSEAVVWE